MELSDEEGQILPEFVDEVSLLCEDLTKSKELPTHHQQDVQTPMEENFTLDNMTSDDDSALDKPVCVARLLCADDQIKSEELQAKIAARDSFACPLHMCKVCNLSEDKNQYPLHFAVCRRRPTAYHRKCVPKDCYEDAVPRAWERLLPYNRILYMMLILMCILGSTIAVNASSCSEKEKKLKEDNKKNYIMLGLLEAFAYLVAVYLWIRVYTRFKTRRMIRQRQRLFKRNGGLLLQQRLHSNAGSIESIKIFSSSDLDNATEGFSTNRVLGQGGQGTVYKGMLLDGRIVAVKKSKAVDEHNIEQFINELVILSQINHRNIVKVLGCCLETEVPSLVYEFVSNGDLSHLLHHSTADTPWELRLRIATDVAGALSYMHSDASFKIYHRDIKSSNIMIDENHRAKVSDFGISRFLTVANTHLSTGVAGTVGYLDPEYFQTGQYTQKSDVYSFGVVLIELITGEKTVTPQNRCLARNFALAVKQNRLVDVIDVRIKDHHNLEQVTAAARLARRCVRMRGTKRPRMREVSIELERIGSSEIVSPQPLVESDEEDDVLQFDIDSSDTASSSQFQTPASTFSIDVEQLLVPTERR